MGHDVIDDCVGQFQNLAASHEKSQNFLAIDRSPNDQVPHFHHEVVGWNVEAVVVDDDLACRCNLRSYRVLENEDGQVLTYSMKALSEHLHMSRHLVRFGDLR